MTQRLDDPVRAAAHRDREMLSRPPVAWAPISLPVPTLEVGTDDGWSPGLSVIVRFAAGRSAAGC